jgi:hypothetical protein
MLHSPRTSTAGNKSHIDIGSAGSADLRSCRGMQVGVWLRSWPLLMRLFVTPVSAVNWEAWEAIRAEEASPRPTADLTASATVMTAVVRVRGSKELRFELVERA